MLADFSILSFNLFFSTIAFALMAAWYLWPWLRKQPKEVALQILIWPMTAYRP